MYHIKSDKRSRASAEEITNGLYRCLERMPLSAVTVSDLHRETGISRATIYRLFDTPEDILLYQVDQRMDWIIQFHETNQSESSAAVFEGIMLRGLENHALLEALVKNRRFDILHDYTKRTFQVYDHYFSIFPKDMGEMEADYILSNLSMNLVSNLITWIRRGRIETAQQLFQFTKMYLSMMVAMTEDSREEAQSSSPSEKSSLERGLA